MTPGNHPHAYSFRLYVVGGVRCCTAGVRCCTAGVLFNRRGTLLCISLCSLSVMGLIWGEKAGWLPPADMSVTITQWVSYTVFFIMAGFLTDFTLRTMKQALQVADAELLLRRQAESALRQSEVRLRAITDNMHEMVWLLNLRGVVQYANLSYHHHLGYLPEKMIGLSGLSFIHPDDRLMVGSKFQQVVAEQSIAEPLLEFRCRHAAGHYVWIAGSAQFVYDEGKWSRAGAGHCEPNCWQDGGPGRGRK